MNILFVFFGKMNPRQGGVERVSMLLAEEFSKRNHKVTFLSISDKDEEDFPSPFRQIVLPYNSEDFNGKFAALLEDNAIDFIILQGAYKHTISLLDIIPERMPKVLVLHNKPHTLHGFERKISRLTPSKGMDKKSLLLRYLAIASPGMFKKFNDTKNSERFRFINEKADRFILLSNRFIPSLLAVTPGLDETKITAINNPNTFACAPSDAPKKNVVLFVGRLTNRQKNVTGFIDVWKKFSKAHPEWEAKIVGDGEDREMIEKYARRKKVQRLSFEGSRSNISDYYGEAKILCMTSTYEGWPMVLAEAMAYGCVPVVYDSFEAAHDIIDNGANGFLVDPFSATKMTEKLSLLASDDALREKMADQGREKIKDFEVEKIADHWEVLFNELRK